MAPHPEVTPIERVLSPMAIRDMSIAKTLVKRDQYKNLAAAGARPPTDLKGPGFQVLFALIAVGMTLTALWFFFWAKNGGFKWRGKQDWEDYKTTVMRRKGPDGKTLSNATASTKLGGGSVVHGGSYGAESSVGYTDETGTSADISEYRDAEEGKGGLRGGDGRKEKKHRRDHTNDYKDPELRNYRNEKAARVGGLNRAADGMYTDYSGSQPSELGSNVSSRPLVKKEAKNPKKEAKEKERRAKERMRNAKAAEKEAAKTAAAEAKARREAEKAEAKREKAEQKKMKKARSEATPSEAPEMAEVTRPLTEYNSEYTRTYTEYTAPSEAGRTAPTGPSGPRRSPPSAAYSFTTGDDTNTVYSGAYTDDGRTVARTAAAPSELNESSYYSDYRPNADSSVYTSNTNNNDRRSRSARPSQTQDRTSRQSQSQPRPRPSGARPSSQSPRKQHRTSRPAAPPSDIFTATNGDAHGHMSYPCHIPGLSQAGSVGVSESVSQVGGPSSGARRGRDVMDGYRRGGVRAVGRRDSLSDSDRD